MAMSFTSWDKDPNYLAHFGITGMHWGQRRFQNHDGSLTPLGKERYGKNGKRSARGTARDLNKIDRERTTAKYRVEKNLRKIEQKDARYAQKYSKAKAFGDSKKMQLYKKKRYENAHRSKELKKARAYQKLANKDDNLTNRILKAANNSGKQVSKEEVNRLVNKGSFAAKAVLGAAAAGAAGYGIAKYNAAHPRKITQTTYTSLGGRTSKNVSVRFVPNKNDDALIPAVATPIALATMSAAKYRKGTKYRARYRKE